MHGGHTGRHPAGFHLSLRQFGHLVTKAALKPPQSRRCVRWRKVHEHREAFGVRRFQRFRISAGADRSNVFAKQPAPKLRARFGHIVGDQIAETTQMRCAPAARTSSRFCKLIPPMANQGIVTRRSPADVIERHRFGGGFGAGGATGPMAMWSGRRRARVPPATPREC